MFENHYEPDQMREVRECKPDYEEIAAKLKVRIDADKYCLDGMKASINYGSVNLNRDQSVLYYAIIGSLSLSIPKHELEYAKLLEKIEKDNN